MAPSLKLPFLQFLKLCGNLQLKKLSLLEMFQINTSNFKLELSLTQNFSVTKKCTKSLYIQLLRNVSCILSLVKKIFIL